MIIIMPRRKQLFQNKDLAEGINSLHFFGITHILNGDRHDLAASPTPFDQRMPELCGGIDCLLL